MTPEEELRARVSALGAAMDMRQADSNTATVLADAEAFLAFLTGVSKSDEPEVA